MGHCLSLLVIVVTHASITRTAAYTTFSSYRNNRTNLSYWSLGISIDKYGDVGTGKLGGLEERFAGGPTYCSLDANVWCKFGRRLNYLPWLPANEHGVPRVRNGIGRYFITEQRHCHAGRFTQPTHVCRASRFVSQTLSVRIYNWLGERILKLRWG